MSKDLGSVSIQDVSKSFKRATLAKQSYGTLKSSLLQKILRKSSKEQNVIRALDSLSLEIPRGSALGIIGRNGSGKSTLLKLISGIYHPDTGSVKVNGRISALIELGAGFHPDFSGRENVYLGGIMYGLSRKQIDERFRDIVRYAELEDFIDDPVRTYSSGMYMRLGFSLAIHTDPDILLVDEVLAVGDAAFIHRCEETISEFKRRGKTLIFVTHDLRSVEKWCDEAIWLAKGVVKAKGGPRQVIDAYLGHIEKAESEALNLQNESGANKDQEIEASSERWGNRQVEITKVSMLDYQGKESWLYHQEDEVLVEVHYQIKKEITELVFGIGILRLDGLSIHGTNTEIEKKEVPLPNGKDSYPLNRVFRYKIKRLGLLEDSYYLDVAAHKKDGTPYDYHHRRYKFSVRSAEKFQGIFVPEHEWQLSEIEALGDNIA